VSYPAPAAIVVDQPRRYGAVPGIGDHTDIRQTPLARTKSS
jgi:itaconate CoA-transferase